VLPVTVKKGVSEVVIQAVRRNNISGLLNRISDCRNKRRKHIEIMKENSNSMTVLNYAPKGKLNII